MRGLGRILILLVLLAVPLQLFGGDESGASSELARRIVEEEQKEEVRVVGLRRLRLSYPLKVSGGLGLMRVRQPADFDCSTVCDHRGMFFEVEPGLAGIQVGAGWALLVAERKRNPLFLSDIYVGWGIRGALLRTWGDSTLDPSGQTFVGAEADLTVTSANIGVGLFHGVARGSEDERWLFTIGAGWGF
jgi:hypothetical protein